MIIAIVETEKNWLVKKTMCLKEKTKNLCNLNRTLGNQGVRLVLRG